MKTLVCLLLYISQILAYHPSFVPKMAVGTEEQKPLDTEGLYYSDLNPGGEETVALVITRKGNWIPHKLNDPEAPIRPGLYIGGRHYKFLTWNVNRKLVTFQTERIGGRSYKLRAVVHRVTYSDIPNVPELRGLLIETSGGISNQRAVRFGHAVIA